MQNEQHASSEELPIFLPYSPRLRELLKSYGASLLLIYLEGLFRATQDTAIVLDVDRTRRVFSLSPWGFWKHVTLIAVGWRSAKRRELARLAGREFLTRATRGAGAHKPYSYLRVNNSRTIEIHRHEPRVIQLLQASGIIPSQPGRTSDTKTVSVHGFGAELSDFSAQTLVREVLASVDGRRAKGLKRKFAHRAKWTEERRMRFLETMARRYGWDVDKRAISDPRSNE